MQEEQRKIIRSLVIPGIFVLLMWLVKICEIIFSTDLSGYGLAPLQWKGLIGIITAPFLHANFSHLAANTFPFFFLLGMLFYFYKQIAWRTLIMLWILTGLWIWVFAREDSVHIGASGIVYGLASFLFFSGILRRDTKLMAITLLIAFLYGGLVWGIFPQLFPHQPISWESHLMGLLAGMILAFYYRKSGPQRKVYEWEEENDDGDNDDDNDGLPGFDDDDDAEVHYEYKE